MHRFAKTLAVVAQRSALPLFKAPQAQRVALNMSPMKIAVRSFSAEAFLDPKVVEDRVISVISNFEKVAEIKSKVVPGAKFKEDLDLDSLDAVEVVMAIEEEFGIEIPDSEADKIWSVADAVAYVSGHPMAK